MRYLRTLDDSETLRSLIASSQRVIVIGAGFIGLEFAATARAKGLEVDVVELAARVMARAVTAEISEFSQSRHLAAGIRIHFGVQATSIENDGGKVTGVSLSDGRHLPADLVVVGVGVLPNVELAADAGLPVAAGIIVDEYLSTADPNISAIGDCALYAIRASAARCGWSRCRTPPTMRAASPPGSPAMPSSMTACRGSGAIRGPTNCRWWG